MIFFCPADHVPDWQPRILLGMVEARSVNVKNIRTHKHTHIQHVGRLIKKSDTNRSVTKMGENISLCSAYTVNVEISRRHD